MDENATSTTDAAASVAPSVRRPLMPTAARIAFVPYLVFVALVVFLPADDAARVTGIVQWAAHVFAGWGLPLHETAVVLEFVANIALFVPFGLLARFAMPRIPAWTVVVAGCLTSTAIELVQLAIPSRVATVADVIANTLGAVLGVVLAAAVRSAAGRRVGRRDPA
ncbi:VanZ family protein [Agromyces sp. NPDC058110]|uniref:VanZ family protein n=1 Tax=Agromyces sp. NPDC058110 TaxID=3346345 RepID=UPI0036D75DBF